MKLQDKETLSVADAVKDVLEGKTPLKEMDPKDHVSEKGDKFVVKNVKGDIVKEFETREEAENYAVENHDDLMQESPEQPNKPNSKLGSDEGEKKFKDKHVVKRTVEEVEKDDDDETLGLGLDSLS